MVFRGKQSKLGLIVEEAEAEVAILNRSKHNKRISNWECVDVPEEWVPPRLGNWSFNVDGLWLEGENLGSVAGICSESRGSIVAGSGGKNGLSFRDRNHSYFASPVDAGDREEKARAAKGKGLICGRDHTKEGKFRYPH